jgi:hypothetical protein
MARVVADELGGVETIETALLLSVGDETGPASFDYFLRELTMPFAVHIDGERPPGARVHQPAHDRVPFALWATGRVRISLF